MQYKLQKNMCLVNIAACKNWNTFKNVFGDKIQIKTRHCKTNTHLNFAHLKFIKS